jgi:hypothetical protein
MGTRFRVTNSTSAMKGALGSPRFRVLGLLGVFLLALFVRLPGLDRPAQLSFGPLYQDEFKMLTNTVRVMKGTSLLPHWPYGIYRLMAPQFQATRLVYTLQCGRSLLHPISVGDLRRLAEAQLDRFFILIRAHALILGLGIVFLTFVLGRRISGDAGGLASALVVAITPLMVSYSRMMYYDIAMVAFFLFYIIAFAKAICERSIGYVYVAVALSAAAFTMKQNAVILFVADGWLLLSIIAHWRPWRLITNRHSWVLVLMATVILWYGYPTLFTPTGITGFIDSVGSKYYGAQTAGSVPVTDRLWWVWIRSFWIDQAPPMVFLVLVVGTVIGVFFARDRYVAASALGLGLLYYAIAGYSTHAIDRTMLPLIPLLALGMAGWIAFLQRISRPQLGMAVAVTIIVYVSLPLLQNTVRTNLLLGLPDTRVQVATWFAENVPEGTTVARETYAPWLPSVPDVSCPAGIGSVTGHRKLFSLASTNSLASKPPEWYRQQSIHYLIYVEDNYKRLIKQQEAGFVESPTDTSAYRMGKSPRYGVPIEEAIARYDALSRLYPVAARFYPSPLPSELMHRCATYVAVDTDNGTPIQWRCGRPSFDTLSGLSKFLLAGWLDPNFATLWKNRHNYVLGRAIAIYDTGTGS